MTRPVKFKYTCGGDVVHGDSGLLPWWIDLPTFRDRLPLVRASPTMEEATDLGYRYNSDVRGRLRRACFPVQSGRAGKAPACSGLYQRTAL